MTVTFLGTGSAIPIPRRQPDGSRHDCPQCRSKDPRDRRWPSALLIDRTILIDAPPPIHKLLSSAGYSPAKVGVVFLTHSHDDASGGLASLPRPVEVVFPRQPDAWYREGHRLRAVRVPHDRRTWGYLVDDTLAYFSDYADIRPALPALSLATVAVLDGSGWETAFPTHQPLREVIPHVRLLSNLKKIYITHVGHMELDHRTLEQKVRQLGDSRFAVAYHGLKVRVPIRTQVDD